MQLEGQKRKMRKKFPDDNFSVLFIAGINVFFHLGVLRIFI